MSIVPWRHVFGVNVTVLVCVCQRLEDVVHQMLGRSSPVLVGGRRRSWWPTREQRLVRRLIGEGYPVVFAQVGATPLQARGMAAALRVFWGTLVAVLMAESLS